MCTFHSNLHFVEQIAKSITQLQESPTIQCTNYSPTPSSPHCKIGVFIYSLLFHYLIFVLQKLQLNYLLFSFLKSSSVTHRKSVLYTYAVFWIQLQKSTTSIHCSHSFTQNSVKLHMVIHNLPFPPSGCRTVQDVTIFNMMFPASLDLTPSCNFFPKFLFPKHTYVSIISLYFIPYNQVLACAFLLTHTRITDTAAVKT